MHYPVLVVHRLIPLTTEVRLVLPAIEKKIKCFLFVWPSEWRYGRSTWTSSLAATYFILIPGSVFTEGRRSSTVVVYTSANNCALNKDIIIVIAVTKAAGP